MPKFLKKLYKGIRIGVKVVHQLDKAGIVDVNEAKVIDKVLDQLSGDKEKDGSDDLSPGRGNVSGGIGNSQSGTECVRK